MPRHVASAAAALAVWLAVTLAGPAAASAGQGFGYNDPRSVQIDPLDVSPLGGGGFLSVDFSDGSGEILRYEAGRLQLIAGGGKREPRPDQAVPADQLRLFSLHEWK